MSGVTPIYGFPFQSLTDPPDGASLGEDLALAIEQILADRVVGRVSRLSSNISLATSSTALQTIGLSVPVDVNDVYLVSGAFHHVGAGAGTTEDIKYSFAFPAGASLRIGWCGGTTGGVSGATASDMNMQSNTITSLSANFSFGASSAGVMVLFSGQLTMGATPGDFTVQAAQNTSGATVISVLTGSYIKLLKVT